MDSQDTEEALVREERDINYRLVLLEKQKKDRAEEKAKEKSKGKRKSNLKKRKPTRKPAKHTAKRSKPNDDESEEEEGGSPKENDESSSSSDAEENDTTVGYYQQAQEEEQARIDQLINRKREEEIEKKDILLHYAHKGLVTGCTIVDREIGYDGSFGEVMANDEFAMRLLKHQINSTEAVKKYYSAVASWGLCAYVGMKYIETRPGLLGGLFQSFMSSPDSVIYTHEVREEESDNDDVDKDKDRTYTV